MEREHYLQAILNRVTCLAGTVGHGDWWELGKLESLFLPSPGPA